MGEGLGVGVEVDEHCGNECSLSRGSTPPRVVCPTQPTPELRSGLGPTPADGGSLPRSPQYDEALGFFALGRRSEDDGGSGSLRMTAGLALTPTLLVDPLPRAGEGGRRLREVRDSSLSDARWTRVVVRSRSE